MILLQPEGVEPVNKLDAIYEGIGVLLRGQANQKTADSELAATVHASDEKLDHKLDQIDQKLDQIHTILTEPPPIADADITFEENTTMTKLAAGHKGKLKFVLNTNGTATGTISFTDTTGTPTQAAPGATIATTLTSSNPAAVTATVDATGLIVTATPVMPVPMPIPTGVIIKIGRAHV